MNGKGFRGKLTLRTMAMPADTNTNGDVFGDWLVSQMDLATAITAKKHAKSRVTTIAIESVSFKRSVSVGDIVGIYCDLYKVQCSGQFDIRQLSGRGQGHAATTPTLETTS